MPRIKQHCDGTLKAYALPTLPYGYGDLAPNISEEQLRVHHTKHHQAYVNNVNAAFERLDKAIREGSDIDRKAFWKDVSFNLGGHVLHSLFWPNMAPQARGGGGSPGGRLADYIDLCFGGFDRFKKEFSVTANTGEGSAWAALTFSPEAGKLALMQIEKHNVNVYPNHTLLMVLDVWEHAYYLDYKNDRAKFVEAFWNIVNWDEVGKRFEKLL
ncbi:MAG: superoxide dismutase [Nitrososphaeria archaeon]